WRRARGRQGQALRARLRASLTAPARDASSAAQGRDEETAAQPNKETGRPGLRARRGMTPVKAVRPRLPLGWMKGRWLCRPGVPVPIPTRCREAGKREPGTERRSGVRETVAVDGLDDAAGVGEQADALVEGGGPDPASGAQVGERKRLLCFGERRRDALIERGS